LLASWILLSCAFTVSFDYNTDAFDVGGTVDGLEGASKVTLLLNGASPISVGNGSFSFHAGIADGQYIVTVQDAQGHVCSTERGGGTVTGKDVTDVAVHCLSTDATLKDLSLSAAPLSPAFNGATAAYTAGIRMAGPLNPVSTTVTATSDSPSARITVGGVSVPSGTPSAPISLGAGPHPIDVAVTAGDGKTQVHYAIVPSVAVYDYVKASNTRAFANFGQAIAFAGDTLAVGSPGESSKATGINGGEADTTAPNAGAVYVYARTSGVWTKQAYVKASNARRDTLFGMSLALSEDGNTLAVGAPAESSATSTINGNQSDTSAPGAGAVYVFTRVAGVWTQQAYVKASNARLGAYFGNAVAVSSDTLVVGSSRESSAATTINGNEADTSAGAAGAVYVYVRTAGVWSKQAYVKASNGRLGAYFGYSLALAGDTLVVGAQGESSGTATINGSESDTSASGAGAAYVYVRAAGAWMQQAYVKASNARSNTFFGSATALSSTGDVLAVGANNESSGATTINGDQKNTQAPGAGAVYVYRRVAGAWTQDAYVKASNASQYVGFGSAVVLSADGTTLGVGAPHELSGATLLDGDENDVSAPNSGAAYLYTRAGGGWAQRAYVKASNTHQDFVFGTSLASSGDTFAVGAPQESSSATLINGDQTAGKAQQAGAVYVY
jgi:hypothetical protein